MTALTFINSTFSAILGEPDQQKSPCIAEGEEKAR
jgi:hypothetical protein